MSLKGGGHLIGSQYYIAYLITGLSLGAHVYLCLEQLW